jgi:hypothetical protein
MQDDAVGKFETGIEKELPDSLAGPARIILRHEWIAMPDYGILDFAQTILQPFTSRTVDMAAAKNDMLTGVSTRVDTKTQADKRRVLRQAV